MQTAEGPGPVDTVEGHGGPTALFTAAYRAFSGPVRGYLHARGVDDPDAVTHDVFLALYTRMKPPKGAGSPGVSGGLDGAKALAFTIAHGRAVDHHRRRARTPHLVPHEAETDPRRAPTTPEDSVVETSGALELLDILPDDYREVLLLRVVADLSIEQTAAIMDRTAGAVKQLQRRALTALRNHVPTTELSRP
ncbi:sigma-70 family RNA polymerase sigma factor [Sinomonas sp. ASV486]|uniref:RNA polymerase sigma factor n=1 Tax=Sinomonas puerhi TaxID=3238584 RepID=A0AB39L6V1_9MICC|nr:sigma-70 family RNA polymerase sigma factor [Sinomonas sp. ASV486]MDQ4489894.1 sigma-70 family RNA polymerase sigma factor [Sinomonas sp. ASV486]